MVELDLKSEKISLTVLIGFLTMFASLILAYADLRNGLGDADAFIENQRSENTRMFRKIDDHIELLTATIARVDRLEFQIEQMQQNATNTTERIGVVTESFSNQMSSANTLISRINIELAIVNQMLRQLGYRNDDDRGLSGLAPDEVGR